MGYYSIDFILEKVKMITFTPVVLTKKLKREINNLLGWDMGNNC